MRMRLTHPFARRMGREGNQAARGRTGKRGVRGLEVSQHSNRGRQQVPPFSRRGWRGDYLDPAREPSHLCRGRAQQEALRRSSRIYPERPANMGVLYNQILRGFQIGQAKASRCAEGQDQRGRLDCRRPGEERRRPCRPRGHVSRQAPARRIHQVFPPM